MTAFGELTIGAMALLAVTGMVLMLMAKPAEGPLSLPRLGLGAAMVVAAVATVILVLRH